MHIPRTLLKYSKAMCLHYGPTGWWPGETPFEIAIGAILTQNTAWTNVEKALVNLRRERLLGPRRMLRAPTATLESALRPSGYYRQKTERVRLFCAWLQARYRSSMARMACEPLETLRPALLSLKGIGPETADDILLYACGKPVFVVDTYTRRIFSRHGLAPPEIGYEELRAFFERHLEEDIGLWREYHGLIVWTGKDFCGTVPRCDGCPLARFLPAEGPLYLSSSR
jgi:endonuclease III related protein